MENKILKKIKEYSRSLEECIPKENIISERKIELRYLQIIFASVLIFCTSFVVLKDNFPLETRVFGFYLLMSAAICLSINTYYFSKRIIKKAKKMNLIGFEEHIAANIGTFFFPFAFFLLSIFFMAFEYFFNIETKGAFILTYFLVLFSTFILSGWFYYKGEKEIKETLSSDEKNVDLEKLKADITNEFDSIEMADYYILLADNEGYTSEQIFLKRIRENLLKQNGFASLEEYKLSLINTIELKNY